MDKTTLHKIFKKSYNHKDWIEILQSVFGAKQLYVQPKSILLPNNERVSKAFELGSFTTSDDRIIGLYRIDVKPNVWLERNKVGLRELLRNVYKYDVDGAIVVFVQDEQWRLSFISEIKVLNEVGEIVKQATEPKRYTYLLGKDEKIRTPAERLSKLTGKALSLQDILNAFSVEALNEEFYKIVQSFFYELVGGKIGKGKKVTDYKDGILQLPDTNRNVRQEFAVRLIGRTVFCWFLKMKKSDDGISLLPEILLSSVAVKQNKNYYHTILESLFFQTLNTPMEERICNLPKGAETIPFLNGGLFEANPDDYYKSDGKGYNQYNFGITDDWFLKFFEELEKYNFTIDENSVTEIEVSVDPEMLGRIFENLLAEIDPDSGETARKATGSFYTPREIVDYMATESLVQYLYNQTGIAQDKLRPIFRMLETADPKFTEAERNNILDALDKIKILDPACGSGAFPMGVLQKIVQALQKLDSEAEWWKKRQIDRIKNPTVKKLLKEKLFASGVEYARKIGVIQNSLYGVDIQPVAAEISKLRCFLSLVVDENIDDNRPNRGVEPLPNLEFKFVTADTLLKLPDGNNQRNMFDNFDEMQKLEELRNEYIQSSGKTKKSIKDRFLKVQQKISKDQNGLWGNSESKAYKLGNWDPFGNEKSDWFDPKWMFGVEKFDLVIGNPPYVEHKKLKHIASKLKPFYSVYTGSSDLSVYFFERGFDVLKENGILNYISTNKFFNTGYGKTLRRYLVDKVIHKIINFEQVEVFKGILVSSVVYLSENKKPKEESEFSFYEFKNETGWKISFEDKLKERKRNYSHTILSEAEWVFLKGNESEIKTKIEKNRKPLKDITGIDIKRGVTTGYDPAFIVANENLGVFLNKDFVKPLLKGKEIKKYLFKSSNSSLLFIPWHFPLEKDRTITGASAVAEQKLQNLYPELYSHLKNHHKGLSTRNQSETGIRYEWYALQRCAASYFEQFDETKIIWPLTADQWGFALDNNQHYLTSGGFFLVSEKYSLKTLLAILNSKVLEYYFRFIGVMTAGGAYTLKKATIELLPIATTEKTKSFENLVDYLLFVLSNKKEISDHVSNSHIAQLFEEVANAMVMELYFKEDFEKAGIEFIKYIERDFESIEGKSEDEQIEIIHNAYQKLREKDNEIRNNLKLMDIKLADIVMPIKTVK